MSDWPPRWTGPQFKTGGSAKVARALKRQPVVKKEKDAKAAVRKRDKRCRFPLCGCGKFKLRTEVSHSVHKGMGGNPKGDRSTTELMILVCSARHKELKFSIDKGTIHWVPLTERGANGPVEWSVTFMTGEFVLARERAVGDLEPLTENQRNCLTVLACMVE